MEEITKLDNVGELDEASGGLIIVKVVSEFVNAVLGSSAASIDICIS